MENFSKDWKIQQIRAYIEAGQSKGYDVYLVEKEVMCLYTLSDDVNFGFEIIATNLIGIITEGLEMDAYKMYRWDYVLNGDFNLVLTYNDGGSGDGVLGQVIETLDCNTLLTEYQGINIY